MKLHDLTVGQRFSFSDKHRGKVFEVAARENKWVLYIDVATQERRIATSNREMFRKEVIPVTENRVVELTPHETEILSDLLEDAYFGAESQSERNELNRIHIKLTGSAGRRVVLPEES